MISLTKMLHGVGLRQAMHSRGSASHRNEGRERILVGSAGRAAEPWNQLVAIVLFRRGIEQCQMELLSESVLVSDSAGGINFLRAS